MVHSPNKSNYKKRYIYIFSAPFREIVGGILFPPLILVYILFIKIFNKIVGISIYTDVKINIIVILLNIYLRKGHKLYRSQKFGYFAKKPFQIFRSTEGKPN